MKQKIALVIILCGKIVLSAALVLIAFNLSAIKDDMDDIDAKMNALRQKVNNIEHRLESLGHLPGEPPTDER